MCQNNKVFILYYKRVLKKRRDDIFMNTLLLFFALPVATIILSVVLQKLLESPILVALTFFAVFLVAAFAVFDDSFLVFVIAYTILAYITAVITKFIIKLIRCQHNCNNGSNNENSFNCGNSINNSIESGEESIINDEGCLCSEKSSNYYRPYKSYRRL